MKIFRPFQLILFSFIMLIMACSKDSDRPSNGSGGTLSGCSGGPSTITDIEGNIYNIVQIGNQCWMKENLKVSKYRNGDPIVTNLSDFQWQNTDSGAFSIYDNFSSYNITYGKLYNWYAISDSRGLCPIGWHIPSDNEWNILVKTLDSQADTSVSADNQSFFAGGEMKTIGTLQAGTGLWEDPNGGASNTSGFSGLPGGQRNISGTFGDRGTGGTWWSSTLTPGGFYAYCRSLNYWDSTFFRSNGGENHVGLSVRCVRD